MLKRIALLIIILVFPLLVGFISGHRVERIVLLDLPSPVIQSETVTSADVSLEKTEFHSVAYEFSTTETNIDATIAIEVGALVSGARIFWQPTDISTTINVTGTGSTRAIQPLNLPVAQFARVKVTNNNADPLDIDTLIFGRQ